MSENKKFNFSGMQEASETELKILDRGIKLENILNEKIEKVKDYKSSMLGSKKRLNNELVEYCRLSNEVNEFRKLVREYQRYANSITESHATPGIVFIMSDVTVQIENKLSIYFELVNRKISEISSSRLSFSTIVLSLVAIIISVISIA